MTLAKYFTAVNELHPVQDGAAFEDRFIKSKWSGEVRGEVRRRLQT